jgi:hypothetical protein
MWTKYHNFRPSPLFLGEAMEHNKIHQKDNSIYIEGRYANGKSAGMFEIAACRSKDWAQKLVKACNSYEKDQKRISTIKAIVGGNISYGKHAGGHNDAKRYGDMLDDIKQALLGGQHDI